MRKKKKIFNRVINHNPHGFYNTVQRKLSQAAYAKDVVEIAKKAFKCRNNVAFFLGGVSKFYPKIVPLIEEAARLGNLEAIYMLSAHVGVFNNDVKEGNKLLRVAADGGHPPAILDLAERLRYGIHGVQKKDPDEAKKWLLRLSEEPSVQKMYHSDAFFCLGTLVWPKDMELGSKYFCQWAKLYMQGLGKGESSSNHNGYSDVIDFFDGVDLREAAVWKRRYAAAVTKDPSLASKGRPDDDLLTADDAKIQASQTERGLKETIVCIRALGIFPAKIEKRRNPRNKNSIECSSESEKLKKDSEASSTLTMG